MLTWQQTLNGLTVAGLGCQDLLTRPMTAFFASRQCPGAAIRAAMNWALQQAQAKSVVIGGFHSPLEQSVLRLLIEANSPVVAVLARPVDRAKLPSDWARPLTDDQMAVVSVANTAQRLTSELASARNNLVSRLATKIVVAHASLGGTLDSSCTHWQTQGRQVIRLSSHQ